MTCIIGMKYNGKVYLAGDRQRTVDGDIYTVSQVPKVVKKDNTVRAGCGKAWLSDEFRQLFNIPAYSYKETPHEYIYYTVIPSLYTHLKKKNYLLPEDELHTLLIGVDSELYSLYISNRVVANQIGNYTAIGSGSDIALGAICASLDKIEQMGIVKYMKYIIKIVGGINVYCDTKADVVST